MMNKRVIGFLALTMVVCAVLIILFVTGTFSANKKSDTPEQAYNQWWETTTPDLIIGTKNYYARRCTLEVLDTQSELTVPEIIFEPPTRLIASCKSNYHDPLSYDNGHIIFSVCRVDFGAGGCGRERYRSSDMVNWQEDIGITWVNGEQYTAWRNLGSSSTKADAATRVIEGN